MIILRRLFVLPVLVALAGSLLALVAATPAYGTGGTHVLKIRYVDHVVRLTVPLSWHVTKTAPTYGCGCGAELPPVCIVARGDYRHNPYRCELVVGGDGRQQEVDRPVPDWRLPRCADWTTTYEANARLGRWAAEYRTFLDRCHDRQSEQWTSVTTPSIAVWHPMSWGPGDAAAAAAARSLTMSGKVATRRYQDIGYVRNVRIVDGHAYVWIDRVVVSLNKHIINHNSATYRYRLHTPSPRNARWRACLHDWRYCSADQLRTQFRKGAHPADGTKSLAGRLLWVTTDPAYPRVYDLSKPYVFRFVSVGDTGHCC